MPEDRPQYVYGVLRAGASEPSGTGIEDAPLALIRGQHAAALVSEVADAELQLNREAMMTHARVLEQALEEGVVLPMRFGIVMADEQAVRSELLDGHDAELSSQLEALDGKVELKLRVTYDEEMLMREIVAEDQDVARLRESLRGAPEDATYYGRIRLGELVASAVQRKRELDAEGILDVLGPLALDVQVAEPNHERIVVSASFLVDRERMAAFDAAVDQLGRERAERMRMRYTGPLPAHSFVELRTAV